MQLQPFMPAPSKMSNIIIQQTHPVASADIKITL